MADRNRHSGEEVGDEADGVLGAEEDHDGETDPGVQGDHVDDGSRVALRVFVQIVVVEYGLQGHQHEDEHDRVKHDVECLAELFAFVAEDTVDKDGLSVQEHHPHDHERRVVVELLVGVFTPRESAFELAHPDGDE